MRRLAASRRRTVAALSGAATVLALLATVPPAHAGTAVHAADPAGPTSIDQAIDDALAQAAQTGQTVTVDAATDSHVLVEAQPSGELVQTIATMPVRKRLPDGGFVALDATLQANPDGTYTTAAGFADVTFSGGGTTDPLAVMSHDGDQLSVSWPDPLPAPVVTGDTALYPDVYPGVDLQVTAYKEGGFAEVLIVNTAQAAQNPRLAELTLPTVVGPGLTLAADGGGNLSVTDAAGEEAFHAAAPLMWDSSGATQTESLLGSGDTTADSDAAAPDPGDRVAPLDIQATPGQVRLTPDPGLLTGADVTYPVYIDPTWNSRTYDDNDFSAGDHWAYVQQAYPNVENVDDSSDQLGVGYQGFQSPTGIERAFYQFAIPTSYGSSKHINYATFKATQVYSAYHDCGTTFKVILYNTAPISTSTNWNNQPALYSYHTGEYVAGSYGSCPNRDVNFDVTPVIAGDGNGIVTWRLAGNETNEDAFKRFRGLASLTISYNTDPNEPTSLAASPTPKNPSGQACGDVGSAGWIGKTTTGVNFHSHVSDPDRDTAGDPVQNVRAELHLWDKGLDGSVWTPTVVGFDDSIGHGNYVAGTGGTSTTNDIGDSSFTDGHMYGWDMRAYDGIDYSTTSVHCYFWRDLKAPTLPTASYNPATGQATVTAVDPVPTGGTAAVNTSRVDKFKYSINDPTSLSSSATATVSGDTGTATITPTFPDWGTNYLYVTAIDKAGNQTPGYTTLQVYIPEDPATEVHPGDVDGDGHPDLLYGKSTGLTLEHVTGDKARVTASEPADGPNGSSWNTSGIQIAHRSSLVRSATSGFKDDLWVHYGAALTLYRNKGGAPYYALNNITAMLHPPFCSTPGCDTNYNTDWSGVTQLVAPGDITGDDIPDLITVETSPAGGSYLWLYPGSPISGLLAPGQQLGTRNDWNTRTIIAPAEAPTGTTQALWARNNTGGGLDTYPITENGDGTTITFPDTPTQIGSFPASTYLKITSLGDVDDDGYSDLYVTTSAGELKAYLGTSTTGSNRFDTGHVIDTTGWSAITVIG